MTHTADHDSHDHGGADHGSLKTYMTGFILSVILTAVPFWLVMTGVIDSKVTTYLIITALAAVRIVVHMVYFLHMNPRSEDGWNLMALIFTVVLVVIALIGSLWIIYHLNANMMPDTSQVP